MVPLYRTSAGVPCVERGDRRETLQHGSHSRLCGQPFLVFSFQQDHLSTELMYRQRVYGITEAKLCGEPAEVDEKKGDIDINVAQSWGKTCF